MYTYKASCVCVCVCFLPPAHTFWFNNKIQERERRRAYFFSYTPLGKNNRGETRGVKHMCTYIYMFVKSVFHCCTLFVSGTPVQ